MFIRGKGEGGVCMFIRGKGKERGACPPSPIII